MGNVANKSTIVQTLNKDNISTFLDENNKTEKANVDKIISDNNESKKLTFLQILGDNNLKKTRHNGNNKINHGRKQQIPSQ